jgi:hypothetical protein
MRLLREWHPSPPHATTNFEVRLVSSNGTLSTPVNISSYLTLDDAQGRGIMSTARIPLSAFGGINPFAIRAVRLTFNSTPSGTLLVTNIRASVGAVEGTVSLAAARSATARTAATMPQPLPPAPLSATSAPSPATAPPPRVITDARVASLRSTAGGGVAVELTTNVPLMSGDAVLYMQVGPVLTRRLTVLSDDTRRAVFELSAAELAQLRGGETIIVRRGRLPGGPKEWHFGVLDKRNIDR